MASTWGSPSSTSPPPVPPANDCSAAPRRWANEKQVKDIAHTAHHYHPWQPLSSATGRHSDRHTGHALVFPGFRHFGRVGGPAGISRSTGADGGAPGCANGVCSPACTGLGSGVPDSGAKVNAVPRISICRPVLSSGGGALPATTHSPMQPR